MNRVPQETKVLIRTGMVVRLSRNLDKDRGFCNGAPGEVVTMLSLDPPVFVVKLSHGALVVVHPIKVDAGGFEEPFLPCFYIF